MQIIIFVNYNKYDIFLYLIIKVTNIENIYITDKIV